MKAESIGHKHDCSLAASLQDLGIKPLIQRGYISNVEYEHYISDNGFYGTRPKTKDGCPKIKAESERFIKFIEMN